FIPRLLSFLAHADFNAEVTGLDKFPRNEWPPVLPVHFAFQIMVGCGSLLALVGLVYGISVFKRRDILTIRYFLYLLVLCLPLGFVSVEAGGVVTEVGRQPWIIYGVMKTAEAVTPMPGLVYSFALFVVLYVFLSLLACGLLLRQIWALPNLYLEPGQNG